MESSATSYASAPFLPDSNASNAEIDDIDGIPFWSQKVLVNLRAAEESRAALENILTGPMTVYAEESTFNALASSAEMSKQIKAQQRRIEMLHMELQAAVGTAAEARAALRRSEEARAVLQERLHQMEKELEATSGVFEVYTSELRARQLEVEKRCEEVRVLQAMVRTMSDGGGAAASAASSPQGKKHTQS